MTTVHSTIRWVAATVAVFSVLGAAPFAYAAVSTDKDDYAPGETVTISGDGYLGGETVLIEVTTPYGLEGGSLIASASGEFSWSFVLPNDESAFGDYSYTATGQTSGIAQSGTFTDGNVKIFPIPTTVTFSATITIYDNTTCTGNVTDGPNVETGISSPSGETTGVGNTESVKIQAAAFSDQGGAFIGWTTSQPFVGTSTTAVTGDTICITGNFTGNHDFFANYGEAPGVLVVEKVLVNDNGGTAATTTFSFQINGASTTPFNTEGEVSFSLASSTYSITELAAAGYTTTYSNSANGNADCTNLAVVSNATTTCTITNDDDPPSLTLQKIVVNDDGGTATTTDWTLTATGPTGFSGFGPSVTNADIDAGTYDLSENGPADYSASAWACVGGNQTDDDTVEIGLGEKVICTITNDDIAVAPPGGSSCAPATVGTITITICNRGSIGNVTTADSFTSSNVAGGSIGGRGGRGGNVDPVGNENNGGASAGNGGNGGSGGAGGLVDTGDASADAATLNDLNNTDAEVALDCECGDINSVTIDVTVDNDDIENNIDNLTRARARSGNNTAQGSTGGNAGDGGEVNGGAGSENNGGASAGTGGAGGSSSFSGLVSTGSAGSTAGTINTLNTTRVHIR